MRQGRLDLSCLARARGVHAQDDDDEEQEPAQHQNRRPCPEVIRPQHVDRIAHRRKEHREQRPERAEARLVVSEGGARRIADDEEEHGADDDDAEEDEEGRHVSTDHLHGTTQLGNT